MFETMELPEERDGVAPDGSDVRVLLKLAGGSVAHFSLSPGQTSAAVRHETVEEIWYVVGGRGRMWRSHDGVSAIVDLRPGVCLTIPHQTLFQFRSDDESHLQVVGVTMPPWPVDRIEAVAAGSAQWPATLSPGPDLGSHVV